MSSPYQSKFFNFINRQSQQWRDRAIMAARHLKVAAEWGVQIVLYPIYLAVQAGRMAGRQVGQAAAQSQLPGASPTADSSPQPATSDLPIQRVLAAVRSEGFSPFPSSSSLSPSPPSSPSPLPIQGVASLLENRRLVLVAPENRILDILSLQQQQQLLKRIRAEVANYWYDLRLAQAEEGQFPGLIPDSSENSANVLPPARIFWKAMRWLQASPVALAVNLFRESDVTLPLRDKEGGGEVEARGGGEIENRTSPFQSQLQVFIASYLARLDRQLAEWEAEPSNPVKALVRQVSQQFQGLVQQKPHPSDNTPFLATIKAKFQKITPFSFKLVANPAGAVQNSGGGTAMASDRAELDPFQIEALIRAGIDYFFGQGREKRHLPDNSAALPLAGGEPTMEDPWLFWEDLFPEQLPESAIAIELDEAQSFPLPLPEGCPTPPQQGTSWRERLRRSWQQSRQPNALRTRPTVPNKLAGQQAATGTVTLSCQPPTSVVPVSEAEESLETAFDWVEAKATPVGYVKHPLEQILEWLDVLILWLEESISKGWQWLRQL